MTATRKIAGYREPDPVRVAIVNQNKRIEEIVLRVLDAAAGSEDVDQRWLAIGRTHIEQGFMAINRAVMRPERVRLDEGG